MPVWNRKRTTAGLAALAVLAAVAAVRAQQFPEQPPPLRPGEFADRQALPPLELPHEDPEVKPAQFSRPVGLTGQPPGTPANPGTNPARPVADPPSPVVRIQVRVPADSPPDDEIKYLLTVQNVSQSDAHQVSVRNPIPEGGQFVKADPAPDASQPNPKQIVWSFGTLKGGESKQITLFLKPKPGVAELKNLAYVRFEHGEQVTTRIMAPRVKVGKTAPKQTLRDEPFTVRVLVENTGKVPAENVRVVENVNGTAEVEAVTAGAKRPKPDENQWQWDVGTLMPGQRKVIEYRVTPRQAAETLTLTNVSSPKGVLEKAEARTEVLVPGLSVKLEGPSKVEPGEPARYEITVRNTGTVPSTNLSVRATIPGDCKLTGKKTEGGQLYKDQLQWALSRLEPGDAYTFRFALRASTTGRRVVVASATDARRTRAHDEVPTVFQGTAALAWETVPDPVVLSVGRQGTFTVRVKNAGGEAARNVRVEVELPDAVALVRATPDVRPAGNKLLFGPEVVAANGETTFTITYEAKRPSPAWFRATLWAEALGDKPLVTEKMVDVTGGAR
jgi:uncharacterized repeat protein (TIGR01451 family)